MFERRLKTMLEAQLALMVAEPTRMQIFLESQCGLTEPSEVALLMEAFTQAPVKVYLEMAQITEVFPSYSIVLGEENEDTTRLDDFGGLLPDIEANAIGHSEATDAPYRGAIYRRSYDIYVHGTHPDITIVAYEFLKMLILFAKNAMAGTGFLLGNVSGKGIDPIPRDETGANFIFRRILTLSGYEMFEAIDAGTIFGEFETLEGMHVEGGSPTVPEGVRTLITANP